MRELEEFNPAIKAQLEAYKNGTYLPRMVAAPLHLRLNPSLFSLLIVLAVIGPSLVEARKSEERDSDVQSWKVEVKPPEAPGLAASFWATTKAASKIYARDPEFRDLAYNKLGIHYMEEYSKDDNFSVDMFNMLVVRIREMLPSVLNTKVLKKLLQDGQLRIVFRPLKIMDKMEGVYSPTEKTIYIRWNPTISDERLSLILRNEFHHAAVCKTNQPSGSQTTDCFVLPEKELKLLKVALDEGYAKIKQFKKLFGNKNSPAIKKLLGAVKDYTSLSFESVVREEKAWRFLNEMLQKDEIYKKGAYSQFGRGSLANELAERASDIDGLPKALKELFFPKFCDLFSAFHRVDNYCERPELRGP